MREDPEKQNENIYLLQTNFNRKNAKHIHIQDKIFWY